MDCPKCGYEYDPIRMDMGFIWDCIKCGEWFDLLWLIKDLAWVPDFKLDYESEFREDESLIKDFNNNDYPRLCCDQAYINCRCSIHDEIIEDDVKEYLLHNRIELADVYDREISDCISCEFFATNDCMPLRNLIRFFDDTRILPFSYLTHCKYFTVDPDYAESPSGLVFDPTIDAYVCRMGDD